MWFFCNFFSCPILLHHQNWGRLFPLVPFFYTTGRKDETHISTVLHARRAFFPWSIVFPSTRSVEKGRWQGHVKCRYVAILWFTFRNKFQQNPTNIEYFITISDSLSGPPESVIWESTDQIPHARLVRLCATKTNSAKSDHYWGFYSRFRLTSGPRESPYRNRLTKTDV